MSDLENSHILEVFQIRHGLYLFYMLC